jgi:hypothetical protein
MYNSIMQHTIISLAVLRSLCPSEVAAIESHPAFPGWGRIFDFLEEEDGWEFVFFEKDDDIRDKDEWPAAHKELCALWDALCDAFERATKGGRLGIDYFDIDRCDNNDCIPTNENGCVFPVTGTHETVALAAGEILEGKLEELLVTQYD